MTRRTIGMALALSLGLLTLGAAGACRGGGDAPPTAR